jgi:YidC/Oxa1 family membrane protein insertase
MRFIMSVFGVPLGYIMWAMYQVVHSYGWAIILFTIVTKVLLIPLGIKQQKSNVKMQIIQPKLREIQEKYKNNPQKMNEEVQALYQRENYSMTAGCLPLLIQFPILFGLLDVIYRPLTHLLHVSDAALTQITEIATGLIGTAATSGYAPEISILNSVKANPEAYAAVGQDIIASIQSLDMHFLGLDLSVFPNQVIQWGFSGEALATLLNPIILIPLLSGGTALLMSLVTMRNTPSANASGMGTMMLMMPLMSLWFTFMVPAGVGLYWTMSNLVAVVQSLIMNKFWNPKEIAEKMKVEEEERKERERLEKIEAKKKAKEEGREVEDETSLSQKERNRRRLAEARRRNAEKYGDEYVEVTDEDLK